MTGRQTASRVLHDVGAALWAGGTLMGAVGLNGASAAVSNPTERVAVASAGWARWAPVNAVAIGAHLLGGTGLLVGNADRVRDRQDVKANTIAKLVVTAAALVATAWSGVLGAKLAKAGRVSAEGGVAPSSGTPADVATAQRQLRVLQWAIPALTTSIVALSAQQGEQQHEEIPLTGVRRLLAPVSAHLGRSQ